MANKKSPLKQVNPFNAGINNYEQSNIDQNQALSFNQQYGSSGNYATGNSAVYTTQGNNYNTYGAANTSQDKVTGATTDLNNSFQATTIPGSTHWNTGEHQLSDPNMLADTGRGFDLNKGGSVNTTNKQGLNTFSSEIDPTDKSEFKNEVINNVMATEDVANLSKPVEPEQSQNKFEELYKLS